MSSILVIEHESSGRDLFPAGRRPQLFLRTATRSFLIKQSGPASLISGTC
jgi:hypothetical protein